MVIYGEYLFLENFITGFVIIFFTGKIAGEKLRIWRACLCGALCGTYSFVIFTGLSGFLSLLAKLVFAMIAVWVSFGNRTLLRTAINGALFLLVTVLYGGVTIALLTTFSWEGITDAAGLYMPRITYLTVTCGGISAMLAVWLAISLVRQRRQEERTTAYVTVAMGEGKWNLRGLIDSGNFLREPITGKPVAVVSKALMEEMLSCCEDRNVRYTVIPYSSLGVSKGVMDGYRADYIKTGEKIINRPILAVCEQEEFLTEGSERQILLPGSMLERGIYAKFS